MYGCVYQGVAEQKNESENQSLPLIESLLIRNYGTPNMLLEYIQVLNTDLIYAPINPFRVHWCVLYTIHNH